MQTDRELLELAAKAAGHGEVWYLDGHDTPYIGSRYVVGQPIGYRTFSPLTDDGDALRLALECGLEVSERQARWVPSFTLPPRCVIQVEGNDPYAATRRAIVRAAAEIGRSLQDGKS